MAITLISNFSYYGKNPNFERDTVATKADLRAVIPTEQNKYDYGHIVFCKEDGKHYKFMYNYTTPPDDSEKDAVTGWFKEFATAEGGSVDLLDYVKKDELADVALSGRYDDLSGLPTIPNESKVSDWGFTKNKGTVEAVDTDEEVDDVLLEYATIQYVDNAISAAITTTLNTLV